MRILNLYCGIGGNRKLWGDEHDITAVELDESIAAIYKDLYPNDTVIVADAHDYLLKNYSQFDFIWTSPPCPSHSRTNYFLNAKGVVRYPDLKLYEEIILLESFYKGKYCVENVISYYNPIIIPQQRGRHYFWANFSIPILSNEKTIGRMCGKAEDIGASQGELRKGSLSFIDIDLTKYDHKDKGKLLRNCVPPETGLIILERAMGIISNRNQKQEGLFG